MELKEYMRIWDNETFRFGSLDCFTFAAGAVEVVTGKNHMQGFTKYKDETSAAIALIETFGTLDLRAVFVRVAEEANAVKVPKNEYRDGDIACIQWPAGLFRRSKINQSVGLSVVFDGQMWGATAKGVTPIPKNLEVIDVWRFA